MNERYWENIQGEEIQITEIDIFREDDQLTLTLRFICNEKFHLVQFHGVSRVNIDQLSFPMKIGGFEILDNALWDPESRYRIHDLEEEKIEFYCESIDTESD